MTLSIYRGGAHPFLSYMLPNINHILYLTDLSKHAAYVFRYALRLAKTFDAKISILHVVKRIDPAMEVPILVHLGEEAYQKLIAEKEHEIIDGLKQRLREFAERELQGDPESEDCKSVFELLDALDSYIPVPERDLDKPFLMPVEDVFSISGRGTVGTGRIERGIIHTGDPVEIVGIRENQKTVCTGVEMFRKILDEGQAGDNVGLLLRGMKKEDLERGMVICKPGTVTPHTKFECEVYVLTKEEGGRHTPFFTGYRPQFYFRTTDVTGSADLPEGVEMVMPGDNIKMTIELITPIAMEEGLRFAIREGGRTVGAGVVAKIFE